jgi:hypothetical protein
MTTKRFPLERYWNEMGVEERKTVRESANDGQLRRAIKFFETPRRGGTGMRLELQAELDRRATKEKNVVSITIISPAMEAHVTGCGDIAKTVAKRYSKATKTIGEMSPNVYEGETIVEAIITCDTDLAGWFGQDEPYNPNAAEQAWTFTTCHQAPCVRELLKGVKFDQNGRPSVATKLVRPLVCVLHEDLSADVTSCVCYDNAIAEDIRTTWSKIDAPVKIVKRTKTYEMNGVLAYAVQTNVNSDFAAWDIKCTVGETTMDDVVNWDVARFSGRAWEAGFDGQQYPTLKSAVESFIQEVRTREAFRQRFEGAEK